jgi:hypothetical protein
MYTHFLLGEDRDFVEPNQGPSRLLFGQGSVVATADPDYYKLTL